MSSATATSSTTTPRGSTSPPCTGSSRRSPTGREAGSTRLQERLVREASRVVGPYHEGSQVGFCRAVAVFGFPDVYLADVYVLVEHRGRGLGVALVEEMVERGPFADRAWLLHTGDAHDLYRRFGFSKPDDRLMERPPRKG